MKNAAFRRMLAACAAGIFAVSAAPAWGKSAKEIFAAVARSVVVVYALDSGGETQAQGSGVVVGEDDERDLCLLFVAELSEPPAAPVAAMGADILPGSSGGVLVGITTFKWRGDGLNFAIPME